MNDERKINSEQPVWHIGVVFFAACLLFAGLTAVIKFSATTPAIDADRGAAISKSLAELQKAESTALDSAGWIDQSRGIVRLPTETAMQLVAKQSAENLRKDLIARAEKAAAPAPKTAPKPSQFE